MERIGTFAWTVLATMAALLSIMLIATSCLLASASQTLVQPWLIILLALFLWAYLGIGVGIILGFLSMLEKRESRAAWRAGARRIAYWGNPLGGTVWVLLRVRRLLPGT